MSCVVIQEELKRLIKEIRVQNFNGQQDTNEHI